MKSKLTKVVSLVMAVAIIVSLAMPFASAAKSTKCNVAATPVTGNADNAPMPKGLKEIGVNPLRGYTTVYFNFQVDSSQKVKWVEAWVRYSDDANSKFVKVDKRDTAKNYMRYTSFEHKVYDRHRGATMEYFFRMTDTNGNFSQSATKSAKVVWGW